MDEIEERINEQMLEHRTLEIIQSEQQREEKLKKKKKKGNPAKLYLESKDR